MKNILLFLFPLSLSISTFAFEYKCPENIETTQSISKTPESWSTMVDTMNGLQNFERMEVSDGNPADGASLVPDRGDQKDPYWTNQSLKGFWVTCFYRQSTVRLIREIPKSVKKCTLKHNHGTRKIVADTLICQ